MHPVLIADVFAGKLAGAFCWMLIHSLWQGLLFTIITGIVMLLTKKSSAVLRYNIMSGLFFLFLLVCAGTFILEWNTAGQQSGAIQVAAAGLVSENNIQLFFKNINGYFSANASVIVMGWFAVFIAKCVKMIASLVYSQRVRHHKTQEPPAYWKNKIAALRRQLNIKQTVQLLESAIVKIPVVIGHLKPVIFIPVGLLTSLPAGEVEAVLLHELAHIRRNDYFVNIIQVIAENIFFFNPALLWMSSLLREERENCCDDVAVAQTKSKKQFIQALISFKEHALHTSNYTTAFPARKNQLLHRATRIIHNRNKTLNPAEKIFFVVSFLLLTALSLVVTGNNNKVAVNKTLAAVKLAPAITTPLLPATKVTVDNVKRYFIADKKATRLNDAKNNYKIDAAGAAKNKPYVYEYSSIVITGNNPVAPVPAKTDIKQPVAKALTDQQQADLDRIQAERDREQAERDRKQAELDRIQADRDRDQAMKDQAQALKDQYQAELDRKQAELERLQTIKGEKDRQGDANKQQAAKPNSATTKS